MKAKFVPTLLVLACLATSAAAIPFASSLRTPTPITQKITGDYVEARTASVFAGACHYNGEVVTTGRDAVMAWKFSGGSFEGVNLAGLKAFAAITSDNNLGDGGAVRKAELVIDGGANSQQATALTDLLKIKCFNQLGQIISVRRAPIVFTHSGTGYDVSASGFGTITVDYRTDNSCCVQPGLVWYTPLAPLDHRMVGYTEVATYTGTIADQWQRSDEDSAFYGGFTY